LNLLSTLVIECAWGLPGFGLWLQLMHCAYLLTLSKYFKWGQTFGLWMKSEASLHMGGSKVMKLEGSAFRVSFWGGPLDRRGKVLEYSM